MHPLQHPDLRPLQQPLTAKRLRAARAWLREHRQPRDVPSIGLGIGGWVMLVPGLLIAVTGLAVDRPDDADPAMPYVGAVMTAIGLWLVVWWFLRRRHALRRAALLIEFAQANGLAYAQRAYLGPKPPSESHSGSRWVSWDVLRAPDGAEWGTIRFQPAGSRGTERQQGYLELAHDARGPNPDPGIQALLNELHATGRQFDVTVLTGRLWVIARKGWRVEDPAVQSLVQRLRGIMASTGDRIAAAAHAPLPSAAVESDPAQRRLAMRALLVAVGAVLVIVLVVFLRTWLRNVGI